MITKGNFVVEIREEDLWIRTTYSAPSNDALSLEDLAQNKRRPFGSRLVLSKGCAFSWTTI